MGTEAEIRRERIGRLMGQIIWPATTPMSAPLQISISRLPGEPIAPELASTLTFSPFQLGTAWGGAWSTAWFKAEGRIPDEFDAQHVVARVDLGYRGQPGFGGEAIVFDGAAPRQGLNPKHNTVEISPSAEAGAPVALLVEMLAAVHTFATAAIAAFEPCLLSPARRGPPPEAPPAWLGCRPHLLLDVVPGLSHCPDLLRVLVGDLHLILLLERHDQLHQVEGVRVQVLHERRLRRHLLGLHAELIGDDRLEPVEG